MPMTGDLNVAVATLDFDEAEVYAREQAESERDSSGESPDDEHDDDGGEQKKRFEWTAELHAKFVEVVNELGTNAVPSRILEQMGGCGVELTRHQVSSHLQKYRMRLLPRNPKISSLLPRADKTNRLAAARERAAKRAKAKQQAMLMQMGAGAGPGINPASGNPPFMNMNMMPVRSEAMPFGQWDRGMGPYKCADRPMLGSSMPLAMGGSHGGGEVSGMMPMELGMDPKARHPVNMLLAQQRLGQLSGSAPMGQFPLPSQLASWGSNPQLPPHFRQQQQQGKVSTDGLGSNPQSPQFGQLHQRQVERKVSGGLVSNPQSPHFGNSSGFGSNPQSPHFGNSDGVGSNPQLPPHFRQQQQQGKVASDGLGSNPQSPHFGNSDGVGSNPQSPHFGNADGVGSNPQSPHFGQQQQQQQLELLQQAQQLQQQQAQQLQQQRAQQLQQLQAQQHQQQGLHLQLQQQGFQRQGGSDGSDHPMSPHADVGQLHANMGQVQLQPPQQRASQGRDGSPRVSFAEGAGAPALGAPASSALGASRMGSTSRAFDMGDLQVFGPPPDMFRFEPASTEDAKNHDLFPPGRSFSEDMRGGAESAPNDDLLSLLANGIGDEDFAPRAMEGIGGHATSTDDFMAMISQVASQGVAGGGMPGRGGGHAQRLSRRATVADYSGISGRMARGGGGGMGGPPMPLDEGGIAEGLPPEVLAARREALAGSLGLESLAFTQQTKQQQFQDRRAQRRATCSELD